jgi:hypothetical protein
VLKSCCDGLCVDMGLYPWGVADELVFFLLSLCCLSNFVERLFNDGEQLKSMVPVGDKLLKAPRNAKELMATRLLEGHFVRCSCRGIQVCYSAVS